MSRLTSIRAFVLAIVIVGLSAVGIALAESGYLGDGAYKETWTAGDGWWTKTSTAGTLWYRVYTDIRGWGGEDEAKKDEAISDCYHCSTTIGTGDNAVSNFWNYGATLHKSRYQITSTEYAGYTSDDGNHSSYGCWAAYCYA